MFIRYNDNQSIVSYDTLWDLIPCLTLFGPLRHGLAKMVWLKWMHFASHIKFAILQAVLNVKSHFKPLKAILQAILNL
jgi:hypothetical protein